MRPTAACTTASMAQSNCSLAPRPRPRRVTLTGAQRAPTLRWSAKRPAAATARILARSGSTLGGGPSPRPVTIFPGIAATSPGSTKPARWHAETASRALRQTRPLPHLQRARRQLRRHRSLPRHRRPQNRPKALPLSRPTPTTLKTTTPSASCTRAQTTSCMTQTSRQSPKSMPSFVPRTTGRIPTTFTATAARTSTLRAPRVPLGRIQITRPRCRRVVRRD